VKEIILLAYFIYGRYLSPHACIVSVLKEFMEKAFFCYNWVYKIFFGGFWMSSRSIVDEIDEADLDKKDLTLEDVGDMLFLIFSAIKDLEAKVDDYIASGRSSS
jgi:hypothetical protein